MATVEIKPVVGFPKGGIFGVVPIIRIKNIPYPGDIETYAVVDGKLYNVHPGWPGRDWGHVSGMDWGIRWEVDINAPDNEQERAAIKQARDEGII